MALITNPTAIRLTNERIRPMADLLGQTYHGAKVLLAEWQALQVQRADLLTRQQRLETEQATWKTKLDQLSALVG